MKSQLLILGNGFDLHCGLKSSYKDFFRQAILDTTTENFDVIQLKPEIVGFWEKLLLEYHKMHRDIDYKWCDVENIIKTTLYSLFIGETSLNTNQRAIAISAIYYVKNNHIHVYPKIQLNSPIVNFLFDYCVAFFEGNSINIYNCSDNKILRLLIENLLSQLHSFERRFCRYIKDNIVNPSNPNELNEKYLGNAVAFLSKLLEIEEHCFQYTSGLYETRKLQSTYILSFNYTAIFDFIYDESPCNYSNVHGKLCHKDCTKECKSSSIIFGIDDILIQSQSEYNDLRVFSKTYRKMLDRSEHTSVMPKNEGPIDIKFYGHSLSEADYSYFQSIFDYYNLYGNNNVSLIFYYSDSYDPTDAVYRLINSYGKSLTNYDQGKNLMHKLLLENRIKIIKIS